MRELDVERTITALRGSVVTFAMKERSIFSWSIGRSRR